MKKTPISYKGLSLRTITDARFSHLFLLLIWITHFAFYFLTEWLTPHNTGTAIHCVLDYQIPFCEWFVIPYVGWYGLLFASTLYFLFYNVASFKRFQIFILVVQIISTIIFIVFPNFQPLRPDSYPRDNFLTDIVILLQSHDTNSNVCPSVHVAYSLALISAWLKETSVSWLIKSGIVAFCVLICASTVFIKQHSIIDGVVAFLICIVAEFFSCYNYWKHRHLHQPTKSKKCIV